MMYARAFFSLSWILGPAVSTFVVEFAGFGTLFAGAAALSCFAAFSLILCMPKTSERPEYAGDQVVADAQGGFSRQQVATTTLLVASFVALQAVNSASVSFLGVLVSEIRGLALSWSGVALGVCAALEAAFLFILGRFASLRRSKAAVVAIGAFAGLVYVLALTVFTSGAMIDTPALPPNASTIGLTVPARWR